MDRKTISFVLGERLKALRDSRNLSHVELANQLNKKYGISISRDSIMAYEIADEWRAKASKLPNMGMRVEYLYYLADFYGVSTDYLLGKTDESVPSINIRAICEQTRLSAESVEKLTAEGNGYAFARMLADNLIREWHMYQPAAHTAANYWGQAEIADLIGSQKSEWQLLFEQMLSTLSLRFASQDGSKMHTYVPIPACDAGDFYHNQAVREIAGIATRTIKEYTDMLKPALEEMLNVTGEGEKTQKDRDKLCMQAILARAKELFSDELGCDPD